MKKSLFAGLFAFSFVMSGGALAAEFADGAKVTIKGIGRMEQFTLIKQGEDKSGDGIYLVQSAAGPFLTVMKPDAGQMVGYTNGPDRAKASKWILHKNSSGWSIIAAGNGANTVARVAPGKLALQRNQGSAAQVWAITPR